MILKGHKGSVASTKFSPNGRLLATSSADSTSIIWDARSGIYLRTMEGHTDGISCAAWCPMSSALYTASDDFTCKTWDVETGKEIASWQDHTNYVFTVDASPRGKIVSTGSFDCKIKLWDPNTNKCIRTLSGHNDPVTSVHFNRDGTLLVSGSYDGLIRVWDVKSGQCLRTVVQESNPPVSCAKFSPNGKFVLAGTFGGTLRLWNYAQTKPLKVYHGHLNDRYCLHSTFFVNSGITGILSGSEDGHVYMWDLQTKRVIQRLSGHSHAVLAVDAHPTDATVVSGEMTGPGGDTNPVVRLWKTQAQEENSGKAEPLLITAPVHGSSFQ